MEVFNYIRRSWESYKENWMSFVVAELLVLIIVGIIALIGIGIILSSAELSALILLSPREFISRIVSVLSLLEGVGKAFIFFVTSGLVWVFLKTGLYGMAAQALRGRTRVNTMFKVARRMGLTGLLTCILVFIIGFFLMTILVLGLGFIFPGGAVVGIILFLFMIILFSLIFPGIVVDRLDVIETIVMSIKIVKKNYFEMLSLLSFYGILALVISLIPVLGTLIVIFVLTPMVWISLVMFYKRKK